MTCKYRLKSVFYPLINATDIFISNVKKNIYIYDTVPFHAISVEIVILFPSYTNRSNIAPIFFIIIII